MTIFVYEDVEYELPDGTSNEEAMSKIQAHLKGTQPTQEPAKPEAPTFVEELGTGFLGRIAKAGAKKLAYTIEGLSEEEQAKLDAQEEADKPKEKDMSLGESLAALKQFAKDNPTEFIKQVGMGLIKDPELLHPALWTSMPVKVAAAIKKAGLAAEVAHTGVRGAAIGAGAEAGTQVIEGKEVNGNKVAHEAAMWGTMGAAGHLAVKGVSAGYGKIKGQGTTPTPESSFTPEQAADLMGEGTAPTKPASSILAEDPKVEASLKEAVEELHSTHGSKKDLTPEVEATLLEPTWKEAHSSAANKFVASTLKGVPDGPRRDMLARQLFEEFDRQSSSYKPKPVVTEADLQAVKEAGEARTVDRTAEVKAESRQAQFLKDQEALQQAGEARTVDTTKSRIAEAKQRLFEKNQSALAEAGESRTVDTTARMQQESAQAEHLRNQQALQEAGEARAPMQDVAAQRAMQKQAANEAALQAQGEARTVPETVTPPSGYDKLRAAMGGGSEEVIASNRAAEARRALKEAEASAEQAKPQEASFAKSTGTAYDKLRKSQGGSIDPKLAAAVGFTSAGALIGAVLDPDNPIEGSLFGGGAALLALKSPKLIGKLGTAGKDAAEAFPSAAKQTIKGVDWLVGQVGTRISNVNKRIGLKALENEMKILSDIHKGVSVGDPFISHLNTLSKQDKALVNLALLNGRFQAVRSTLAGETLKSFDSIVHVLEYLGKEASSRGIIKGELENYFPRMVKNLEGLREVLNVEHQEGLTKVLADKAKALGRELSPEEEAKAVNSYILGRGDTTIFKPGFTKGRSLKELSADLAKFYHDPEQSFHSYVQRMVHEIHTHDFFGKSAKLKEEGLDVDSSIGDYITSERDLGNLTWKEGEELTKLLKARYRAGQVAAHPATQEVKNWTTALVLGDVVSAASNLSGPIMAAARYGVLPALKATLMSAKEALGGSSKLPLSVKDYGLLDTISEEFVNTSRSQVYTRKIMKAAGWSKLDSFEKNTQFNSALLRAQNLTKSDAGMTKLDRLYKEYFGESYPKLVKDLKNGVISDEVKLMSFYEVSKQQPLTKLQRSQFGLEHPNLGGLTLQFKSWMMSQANAARTEGYNLVKEGMKKGDKTLVKEGLNNISRLGTAWALMGVSTATITNLLLGRPVDLDTNDIVTGALKQIGYSDYTAQKFKEGKIKEGMSDYLVPPGAGVIQDLISGESDKVLRHFPVVGRTLAARSESGKERFEKAETRTKRQKATESVKEDYSDEEWDKMTTTRKGELVNRKMKEL